MVVVCGRGLYCVVVVVVCDLFIANKFVVVEFQPIFILLFLFPDCLFRFGLVDCSTSMFCTLAFRITDIVCINTIHILVAVVVVVVVVVHDGWKVFRSCRRGCGLGHQHH